MTLQQLKEILEVETIDFRESGKKSGHLVAKNIKEDFKVMISKTERGQIGPDSELEISKDKNGTFWINVAKVTVKSL